MKKIIIFPLLIFMQLCPVLHAEDYIPKPWTRYFYNIIRENYSKNDLQYYNPQLSTVTIQISDKITLDGHTVYPIIYDNNTLIEFVESTKKGLITYARQKPQDIRPKIIKPKSDNI